MHAQIISYNSSSRNVTVTLEDGSIITVPVLVDFSAFVGQTAFYDNGIILITPQPPVQIVATDPTTVINGALIYNTVASALKVGRSGSWVAV